LNVNLLTETGFPVYGRLDGFRIMSQFDFLYKKLKQPKPGREMKKPKGPGSRLS
jgi:hypothetical protein